MSMPMFERFTEKAIKVVMLAQEEARRLGHNFVGTENLLLGLISEGTGVAAQVLKSMGIHLQQTRIGVEEIIGRGSGFVSPEIPYTPRAKRVLFELAREELLQLGHNYMGTEHLLLALIREGEGVGVRVLENRGVDLSKIRTRVLRMTGVIQNTEFDRFAGLQASASEADFRRLACQVIEELGTPDSRFDEPQAAAVAARFCAALYQWVEPRRLGEVLCSPRLRLVLNDDDYMILTPHVAFVSGGQLQKPASQQLIPKLAAIVLSGSRPAAKRMRLEILMEYGVQVGLLLDLQSRTVTVYRETAEPKILQDRDTLTIEDLFPGWEVQVFRFWPPVESC